MEEKKEKDLAEESSAEKKEMEGEEKEEQIDEVVSSSKKIKNYISIIILLAGLLVGSIFVDVAQFFGQQGVSPRVLKSVDVFPFEGRTWVAYNEPVVNVQVLTDSKCEACDPTEPLKWIKRVMPTILTKSVDVNSAQGEAMISQFKISSLPAFIFSDGVTKTDVYSQAQGIFTKVDNSYVLSTDQVGIKAGKYLKTPTIEDTDPQIGPKDAKVKVVLFSDFQCPYCKAFHDTFRKAEAAYKDKVLFVYKFLPLDIHPQANNAAMAGACANDQGKFWEMADKLYSSQADWSNTTGTTKFKTYAALLGLNVTKFNQCVDGNQFKDKIDADKQMASEFGISGTPAFFVDDQYFGGVVSYDQLKQTLDQELAK
jgi:protein-disulfide isomerase